MPEFTVHTLESAPEHSRKLLRGLVEQAGFVPNLAATMAESPKLLEAFLGLRSIAGTGSLDPVARELVAITVGVETDCDYCVAAHSTFALKLGAPQSLVDAVRSGAALDDPRLQALTRFARASVRRQEDVGQRAQDLIAAGLSPAGILEVLVAIAVPMLAGSAARLAGVEVDGAFRAQAMSLRG